MINREEFILSGLTKEQSAAARTIDRDVVVYAGAGSGKTKTLVAHYLYLLSQGYCPEEIVSITFTEKAAREMKSRIKTRLQDLALQNDPEECEEKKRAERDYWLDFFARIENAPIGTIHSLYSRILRLHPAEAEIDPNFGVIEEYQSNLLLSEVVNAVTSESASLEKYEPLFEYFDEETICAALTGMINKRAVLKNAPRKMDEILSLFPEEPDESAREYARSVELLFCIYERAEERLQKELKSRSLQTFDSLETKAIEVLGIEKIRKTWHRKIRSILVDEFQDTNQVQRQFIELLRGENCSLFVVGDDKQSIYRFRGADVSVFSEQARQIEEKGGIRYDLDRSFRTHQKLLNAMQPILQSAMTSKELADKPYYVPFAPLTSDVPSTGEEPYLELLLSSEKRELSAELLASRLIELKNSGKLRNWGDVALLFRAATGFQYYEDAFEAAGIPYVTVAGKGFYDRQEIRDVLNILRCAADPENDAHFCGFLYSPLIGFTNEMTFRLRQFSEVAHPDEPLYRAFEDDAFSFETPGSQRILTRAREILNTLSEEAGKVRVDELLEDVYRLTDYRTALAMNGSERLWRNLDKLLQDARSAQQVIVNDFLERIETENSSGAREGEAPSDNSGAVQLMTIHKSKGLGFPLVVVADIGYSNRKSPNKFYSSMYGVSIENDENNIIYNLALDENKSEEAAERMRLLYVAMTRVKERLILCGKKGDKNSWYSSIIAALNVDKKDRCEEGEIREIPNFDGLSFYFQTRNISGETNTTENPSGQMNNGSVIPQNLWLYAPLPSSRNESGKTDSEENSFALRVGTLVHKAIELDLDPADSDTLSFITRETQQMAMFTESEQKQIRSRVLELLLRFRKSDIYKQMAQSERKMHEVPVTLAAKYGVRNRIIDLLLYNGGKWTVIDFKTDHIAGEEELSEALEGYQKQVLEYVRFTERIMNVVCQGKICFLDYKGGVLVKELNGTAAREDVSWDAVRAELEASDSPLLDLNIPWEESGIPLPDVHCPFELPEADNAQAELAWPEWKTALFLSEQKQDMNAYRKLGWKGFSVDQIDDLLQELRKA